MAKENFETMMKELESIVSGLQDGNIELDTALDLFEKGIGLSKKLTETLDKAEQKVTKLVKDAQPGEEPFDAPIE